MKYESDILEAIHENILAEFKLSLISEAEMRKFDKLCLPAKAFKEKYAKGNKSRKAASVEHTDLVTV